MYLFILGSLFIYAFIYFQVLEISKQQGNEYFKNEEYHEAIKTYTTILCQKYVSLK